MVSELTSSWALAEYRMAIARIKGAQPDADQHKLLRLIIIVTDRGQAPASADGLPIVLRPNVISEDPESFLNELGHLLRNFAEEMGVRRRAEPQRLLEAKEYRAAVISAMTLLETKLRERLDKIPWPQTSRPMSVRSLVELAGERHLLDPQRRRKLDEWARLRNEVVHSSVEISRAQATEVVG